MDVGEHMHSHTRGESIAENVTFVTEKHKRRNEKQKKKKKKKPVETKQKQRARTAVKQSYE
jgi:hypothetical protein